MTLISGHQLRSEKTDQPVRQSLWRPLRQLLDRFWILIASPLLVVSVIPQLKTVEWRAKEALATWPLSTLNDARCAAKWSVPQCAPVAQALLRV